MKLDNLFTTYEQSKRIKELGFKRETLYGYVDTRKSWKEYNRQFRYPWDEGIFVPFEGIYRPNDELELRLYEYGWEKEYNDAPPMATFTSEELGEILPESIEVFKNGKLYQYRLRTQKSSDRREVYYYDDTRLEYLLVYTPDRSDKNEGFILWTTLAQAMGDMLIYLLENNLLPTNETDG